VSERFNGIAGLHADNIAVIVLANKFSFINGVAPVCIDWNSKYKVHNGDQGQVNCLYFNSIIVYSFLKDSYPKYYFELIVWFNFYKVVRLLVPDKPLITYIKQ